MMKGNCHGDGRPLSGRAADRRPAATAPSAIFDADRPNPRPGGTARAKPTPASRTVRRS